MNKFIFEKEGHSVEMPSYEYLEKILSEYDGDAGLTLRCIKEHYYSNLIMLRCYDNYKFHILRFFKNEKDGENYHVGVNEEGTKEICEIQPGGEITLLYDYYLVSLEKTLLVVQQFLRSNQTLDIVKWMPYDCIEFPIDDRYVE